MSLWIFCFFREKTQCKSLHNILNKLYFLRECNSPFQLVTEKLTTSAPQNEEVDDVRLDLIGNPLEETAEVW